MIEINPGYVHMMREQPVVASAVEHPKVEIIIDDGRRYLNREDRSFDVIIQNTIVYWRSHATQLLSREYLELSRRHLKPGGVLYYNTTSNRAAQKTGAAVFPHVWRFQNMLIGNDSPIEIDRQRFRRELERWKIDGRPVVDEGWHEDDFRRLIDQEQWRGRPAWEDRDTLVARSTDAPVITDDNMASEWWASSTYP